MSDPRPLADESARTAVAQEIDGNLFVEAGAGSGKTTSLVDRVVTLVTKGGVDVGDIAAITFTEAAARELRSRVRERLVEHGVDGGDIESATFTTLHSFALRILTSYPVESGLPPGFAVLDEVRSVLDFERGWATFLGRLGDDLSLLELQQRAAALDPKMTMRLTAVARSFDENWDRVDSIRAALDSEQTNDELWASVRPGLSELNFASCMDAVEGLSAHFGACSAQDDRLLLRLRELVADIGEIRALEPIDQLRALAELKSAGGNAGQKPNWQSPTVAEMRELAAGAVGQVDAAVDRYRQEVLAGMRDLVAVHVAIEVRGRHRAGLVSFHDLLVLAKLLVRSNEQVRGRLHDRYQRILLDEFQDTDPLQIELTAAIASSSSPGPRPWAELLPEIDGGRLTVVGDPKQSIYRFRRADMGVYLRTSDSLADEITELSTNFRSVPGIIDFVNEFFDRRFAPADGQAPYTRLTANRPACPIDITPANRPVPDLPVIVLGRLYSKEDTSAEQLRDYEASDIANLVCTMMEDRWPVFRPDLDGWGDVRLQDIAVLIPSRLSLPSLEIAFQKANIPLRPETTSLIYATQEVRDVLAAVRAVVDPGSSIDVVAALRSALFAIDDEALLSWKLAGGQWDYRQEAPAGMAGSDIDRAFAVLRGWRAQRWWIEPARLVEQVVQDRRLRELSLVHSRPRDRLRRYRFLAEQARLFSETENGGLQDFVAWAEIQASDLARITEPVPPEPDDDAVRVLTVHGAKGLEFPVAVMAGAPTIVNRSRPAPVLYAEDAQPGTTTEMRLTVDNQTHGFDARASVEKVLDGYERTRLQYVAATRARDYLIVCTHHNDRGTSVGRQTWDLLQEIPDTWTTVELAGDQIFGDDPAQLRLPDDDFVAAQEAWLRQQEQVLDTTNAPIRWSATKVASVLAPDRDYSDPSPKAAQADSEAQGHGPAFGSAVHDALELISFDLIPSVGGSTTDPPATSNDELYKLATATAQLQGVPDLVDQVAARLDQALRSEVVRQAAGSRHWRELAVSLALPGGSFDGIIDLVVETAEGLLIVDYKTDYLRPEAFESDLAEKTARYRYQIAAYALAVERLIGDASVVGGHLLFLDRDGVHDCAVPALEAAKVEVARLLGL